MRRRRGNGSQTERRLMNPNVWVWWVEGQGSGETCLAIWPSVGASEMVLAFYPTSVLS